MTEKLKLPIGLENFEEIRKSGFYYVDKTKLIEQLLEEWGKVNLFTRPRRFGKTLNMSMLRYFFEVGTDKTLFDGLYISQNEKICEEYMGKLPVIFLSLKSVEGLNFESAKYRLCDLVGKEARRFTFLLDSDNLTEEDKNIYRAIIAMQNGKYVMSEDILISSLQILSELLYKHYRIKTVILIDEYDVPLDKAFQNGYYREMVALIRALFGLALKTNDFLQFAVLTGCLRIAKESIFTGLNNFNVLSVMSPQFDECFGFTDEEVKEMLAYYGLSEHYEQMKQWYDGYLFGNISVYCPWDVINHCRDLRVDSDAFPEDHWSNTSGNGIVRRFIDKANMQTKSEIEQLIAGEEIVKEIRQELTYDELDKTIDNLWSVLFTTGYLTQRGRVDGRCYRLAIPNREIRELFITQIREWFKDSVGRDKTTLDDFAAAMLRGDESQVEKIFGDYLWNTISIRDTAVSKERKENFYHGILLGLFGFMDNWIVKSNVESGIGYSDILIEAFDCRVGIVIEVKYAEDGNLDAACKKALEQIEEKSYEARLQEDGMRTILKYGIACYKKDCRVAVKK